MGKTFVTSDTWFNRPCCSHYGENHIDYNNKIINAWNSSISDEDTVYVLGGFGICDIYDILFHLKGNIKFLNTFFSPDEEAAKEKMVEMIGKSFDSTLKKRVEILNDQIVIMKDMDAVLSYFPLIDWYGKKADSVCFHGMFESTNMNNNNICCNADKWDLTPVDIDEVMSKMEKFKSMV